MNIGGADITAIDVIGIICCTAMIALLYIESSM